jgi:hypothetical protein
MADFSISSAFPQLQAPVAAMIKQPDVTAQATAIKAVNVTSDQIAATLASVSSGLNIQA